MPLHKSTNRGLIVNTMHAIETRSWLEGVPSETTKIILIYNKENENLPKD